MNTNINKETNGIWEQRWHPILEEWVIVASHRQNRPCANKKIKNFIHKTNYYEPDCYLCPGNKRINGKINPHYKNTFIFENDYPGISFDAPQRISSTCGIYKNIPAIGISKVICYVPEHNLSLAELSINKISDIVKIWQDEIRILSKVGKIKNIVIFENKGEVCGASCAHAHGQIFATNFLCKNIETYIRASKKHFAKEKKILFQDIIVSELEDEKRIIFENKNLVAFLPFFSKYPYEVYITTKRTYQNISFLNDEELEDFAKVLRTVLIKLDNMWEISFPYTMMLHQIPTNRAYYPYFHFYLAIYSPYRKYGVVKHLGGGEIGGGNFYSDTVPEENAKKIRSLSEKHYKTKILI